MPSLMKARSGVLSPNAGGNALAPLFSTGALTIANAITDVTRLAGVQGDGAAYPDSSVGVWPAATNLVTNGNFTTNTTGWTTGGTNTISRSTEQAKFGTTSLKCVVSNSTIVASISATAPGAGVYTASAWIYIPADWDGGYFVFDDAGTFAGSVDSLAEQVAAATTGVWTRFRWTTTLDAGDLSGAVRVYTSAISPTGKHVYIGGVQFEAGSIATPYIETDGGTASRSAGRIQMPAGVLDETQMWFAARVRMGYTKTSGSSPPNSSTLAMFFSWADSSSVYIAMYHGASGAFRIDRKNGGATAGVNVAGTTWTIGDSILVVGYWTATGFGLSLNGAAFGTASSTSIPTLSATTADIASGGTTWTAPADGSVLWYATGLGTLTDADAALFHAWGNNDPLPHMFPKSAQLSFLDPFNGDGTFYRRSA